MKGVSMHPFLQMLATYAEYQGVAVAVLRLGVGGCTRRRLLSAAARPVKHSARDVADDGGRLHERQRLRRYDAASRAAACAARGRLRHVACDDCWMAWGLLGSSGAWFSLYLECLKVVSHSRSRSWIRNGDRLTGGYLVLPLARLVGACGVLLCHVWSCWRDLNGWGASRTRLAMRSCLCGSCGSGDGGDVGGGGGEAVAVYWTRCDCLLLASLRWFGHAHSHMVRARFFYGCPLCQVRRLRAAAWSMRRICNSGLGMLAAPRALRTRAPCPDFRVCGRPCVMASLRLLHCTGGSCAWLSLTLASVLVVRCGACARHLVAVAAVKRCVSACFWGLFRFLAMQLRRLFHGSSSELGCGLRLLTFPAVPWLAWSLASSSSSSVCRGGTVWPTQATHKGQSQEHEHFCVG